MQLFLPLPTNLTAQDLWPPLSNPSRSAGSACSQADLPSPSPPVLLTCWRPLTDPRDAGFHSLYHRRHSPWLRLRSSSEVRTNPTPHERLRISRLMPHHIGCTKIVAKVAAFLVGSPLPSVCFAVSVLDTHQSSSAFNTWKYPRVFHLGISPKCSFFALFLQAVRSFMQCVL
jgi:hypothetical protein